LVEGNELRPEHARQARYKRRHQLTYTLNRLAKTAEEADTAAAKAAKEAAAARAARQAKKVEQQGIRRAAQDEVHRRFVRLTKDAGRDPLTPTVGGTIQLELVAMLVRFDEPWDPAALRKMRLDLHVNVEHPGGLAKARNVEMLGCSTGTGTGDPIPGSPDPVVGNVRWRPLGSEGENKTQKYQFLPLSI
jgi:hypothetical protein